MKNKKGKSRDPVNPINSTQGRTISRREFLKMAGLGGAGLAGLIFLSSCKGATVITSQIPASSATPTTGATTNATTAASASTINLNVSIAESPQHSDITKGIQPWIQELTNRSGGRIKATLYTMESLGKTTEQYDLCVSGAADVIMLIGTQYAGRFPLLDVFNLPFTVPQGANTKGHDILHMLYDKYFGPIHYKDVHILWPTRFQPGQLQFKSAVVKKVADMKGLQIGFPGGQILSDYLKLLGASPNLVQTPDIYTSLDRNVIEGIAMTLETIPALKLNDMIRSITMTNISGASKCVAMNMNTWNNLPSDIQQIFNDLNSSTEDAMDKGGQGTVQAAIGMVQSAGGQINTLAPADMTEWVNTVSSLEPNWVSQMDAKGLPASAMVQDIKAMINS